MYNNSNLTFWLQNLTGLRNYILKKFCLKNLLKYCSVQKDQYHSLNILILHCWQSLNEPYLWAHFACALVSVHIPDRSANHSAACRPQSCAQHEYMCKSECEWHLEASARVEAGSSLTQVTRRFGLMPLALLQTQFYLKFLWKFPGNGGSSVEVFKKQWRCLVYLLFGISLFEKDKKYLKKFVLK